MLRFKIKKSKQIKKIYFDVVHELKEIEKVQLYYKLEKGVFTNSFDSLNIFVKQDSISLPKDSIKRHKVSDLFSQNTFGKINTPYSKGLEINLKVDTIQRKKDSIIIKDTKLSAWINKIELLQGFSQEIIDRERINNHNNGILSDSISIILSGNLEQTQAETNWPTSYEVMYKNK